MSRSFTHSTDAVSDSELFQGIDLNWNVERECGRDYPEDITATGLRMTAHYFETIDAIRAIAKTGRAANRNFMDRTPVEQVAFWVTLEVNEDRMLKGDLDLAEDWVPDSVSTADFLMLLQHIVEADDSFADILNESQMIDYED
tara:strand:- start:4905 stop:5333 length:429 start_codon:yes stop_codon:yes gene_type:complete